MKKILIATLLISGSAFSLAVNAQEVFETETTVQEAIYQEPITLPTEAVVVDETTTLATETVAEAPAEDVGGPQSIVNIPTEQEAVAVVEETQEITLSADDEIRKDGEEKALKIFNAIDADGDESITKEEFLSFHSKLIERKILKSNSSTESVETPSEPVSETPETPATVSE